MIAGFVLIDFNLVILQMWEMSWGANAVYADDFGSSVHVTHNTFWLGAKMSLVLASNQGRDHHLVGNTIRPLPPYPLRSIYASYKSFNSSLFWGLFDASLS